MKIVLVLFVIWAWIPAAMAQDFVYQPTNPAFGGNTFNYQWLLSGAEAQNGFEDPELLAGRNPLEDFQESLNRQILNQLSRRIVANQFGEEGLEEGTFILGEFQIDVNQADGGINIFILDGATGNTTNILVPFF